MRPGEGLTSLWPGSLPKGCRMSGFGLPPRQSYFILLETELQGREI